MGRKKSENMADLNLNFHLRRKGWRVDKVTLWRIQIFLGWGCQVLVHTICSNLPGTTIVLTTSHRMSLNFYFYQSFWSNVTYKVFSYSLSKHTMYLLVTVEVLMSKFYSFFTLLESAADYGAGKIFSTYI